MQAMRVPIFPVRLMNARSASKPIPPAVEVHRHFRNGERQLAEALLLSLVWLFQLCCPRACFGEAIPEQIRELFSLDEGSFTCGHALFRDPQGAIYRKVCVRRNSAGILVDEAWPGLWEKVKVLTPTYEFHVSRTQKGDPFQLSLTRSPNVRTAADRLSIEADVRQLLDADHSLLFVTLKELAETKGFRVDGVRLYNDQGEAGKMHVRFCIVDDAAYLPRGDLVFDLEDPPVLEAFDVLLFSNNITGVPPGKEKRFWVREERSFSRPEHGVRKLVRAVTYQGRREKDEAVEVEYVTEVDSITADPADVSMFSPSRYGISDEVLASITQRRDFTRNRTLLINVVLLLGLVAALVARFFYRLRLQATKS